LPYKLTNTTNVEILDMLQKSWILMTKWVRCSKCAAIS
jgi:hypothetical protein